MTKNIGTKDMEAKETEVKDMNFFKSKKFLWISIGASALLTPIIILTVLLCVNKFSMELSIADGETVYIQYGKDTEIPEVTAHFEGTIFYKNGKSIPVIMEGDVDLQKTGKYEVTYKATHKELFKTATDTSNVTIVVEDKTAPKIELVSNPDYFTSPIATYVEEGFTATDDYDGDITSSVIREEKDGVVTYTVEDSSGNKTTVTRTIVYKDVVLPTIQITGEANMTICVGAEYVEPGYVANDDCDGDITSKVTVEGTVDYNTLGTYTLKYKVLDSYNNVCEVTRTVNVADLAAPVIKLTGGDYIYIKLGDKYSEKGYTATDNIDGNVTSKVTVKGSVNTAKEGIYKVTYQVADAVGNKATVTRNIYVYEKQAISDTINPGDKVVYLTFDDGPGRYTEKLLNILDKYGVKATFFVTNQYPAYKDMIGEAHRRGHTIALHTYTHKYSIYKSEETYYADLKKISDLCYEQTGEYAKIVRFPGGSANTVSRSYRK